MSEGSRDCENTIKASVLPASHSPKVVTSSYYKPTPPPLIVVLPPLSSYSFRKSIAYTLSHSWPELFPVLLNLAFSFPLALPGLIILTIDLITEQVRARVQPTEC